MPPRLVRLLAFFLGVIATTSAQTVDPNFGPAGDSYVYALAAQPNGRVLVGGAFTQLAGKPRRYLGRLNADGSLDSSFATDSTGVVQAIVVQPDGRILIAGQFTQIDGRSRSRIARLNADGTLDVTFDPGAGCDDVVRSLALQPDGKILLAGSFESVAGQPRFALARLNADGSLDRNFDAPVTGVFIPEPTAARGVADLALQPDGRILIVGQFTHVHGVLRNGCARLNADGLLDTAFNPSPAGAAFSAVAVQPDGKILVGGGFRTLGGAASPSGFARLNPDGTADSSFAVNANGSPARFFVQGDGRILVSGFFTQISGQPHAQFARLTPWGAADASFNCDLVATDRFVQTPIAAVLPREDGSLIVGGNFNMIAGVSRNNLARISATTPSRLVNLSTRGFVAAGGDLTVGIGVRGGAKPLLLRGIGPTLGVFGVAGALAEPRLETTPAGAIMPSASNIGWNGDPALSAAFATTGAFGLGAAAKDSALMTSLTAGSMTARVTSAVSGGSGIALAEIYDRDLAAASTGARLVNLSTLGFAGTGPQVLIPGFTIAGSAAKLLLIRVVGPGLTGFGVTDALTDPQLVVLPQGGGAAVASNDNWSGDPTLAAAFTAAGAFSLTASSKDAAVLTQLPPGSYTVLVTGVGGGTGRALVELYDLDP